MSSVAGFNDGRDHSVGSLLPGQNRVLEMIATNTPLDEMLASFVHLIESQYEGMICSAALHDEEGYIRHLAAFSLPDSYRRAIDDISIRSKGCLEGYRALAIDHRLLPAVDTHSLRTMGRYWVPLLCPIANPSARSGKPN